MAVVALANPTVLINNLPFAIVPNTFTFTEGDGEQTVRVQSTGGGSVQSVISNNVETNLSDVKFAGFPTAENIETIKQWKINSSDNAISVTSDGGFTRYFSNAILTSNYEIALGSDTQIDLEFKTDAAI